MTDQDKKNGTEQEIQEKKAAPKAETASDSAVLNGHMEKSMEPLFWLVEYTGCMSVWQTRVVSPSTATQEQEDTLEELYDAALLSPGYLRETAGENYRQSVERAREAIAKRK